MTESPYIQDVTTASFLEAVVTRSHSTPVLVDFWATWCGPCRALGPVLEKLAVEYDGAFVLAKVDTDREQALAMQFQIRSIPTVMLFKDGKAVAGFPGALPEGQIRAFLSQQGVHRGDRAEVWADDPVARVAQLQAAVSADGARDDLRLELALSLLQAGEWATAGRALEALPAALYGDARAARARATLALREQVAHLPEVDPVRRGLEAVLAGAAPEGLAQLLEALRDQKGDDAAPAKEALVAALQYLDDEPLVRETRRKMAAVLF